jgi:capsular exopolysaccharide synthesis family protein
LKSDDWQENVMLKKNNCTDKKKAEDKALIGAGLNFASREAYNRLRTNISFAFVGDDSAKVIGISSACPRDGKSTISLNLAYSLGEAGYKVLLMDADMRRPSICASLDIPRAPGLSNLLAGSDDVPMHEGVLHKNVTVLTSGDIPPNPAELIGSREMQSVIEKFKETYDYIVVDLSPVLAVSDTIAISKYIDGVVIVAKHSSTKRRDITEVIRQLNYANAKILGFVYNKVGHSVSRRKNSYGYYTENYK